MGLCPNFIFNLGASYMSRLPPSAIKSTQNNDAKGHVCHRTTDVATATCHPSLSYSVTAPSGMTVVHGMTDMLMTIIRHVTSAIHTTSYTDDYRQPYSSKYHQDPGAQVDVSVHF